MGFQHGETKLMRKFLNRHGFGVGGDRRYVLTTANIPSYSEEYKTELQVDVLERSGVHEFHAIFSLDATGWVERDSVLGCVFGDKGHFSDAYVVRELKRLLCPDLIMAYRPEEDIFEVPNKRIMQDLCRKLFSWFLIYADDRNDTTVFADASTAQRYWDEVFKQIRSDPRLMRFMEPYKFEEFVAEILVREGLQVQLTKKTRDGGYDILAFADLSWGKYLYHVECKRYSPRELVGVKTVRQLMGVVDINNSTAGIIVTTSDFTRDARKAATAAAIKYRMSLKNYDDVTSWLRHQKQPTGGFPRGNPTGNGGRAV
jgi:Restriction endonuclease